MLVDKDGSGSLVRVLCSARAGCTPSAVLVRGLADKGSYLTAPSKGVLKLVKKKHDLGIYYRGFWGFNVLGFLFLKPLNPVVLPILHAATMTQ